ncbi:hypothetical protein EYF80_055301 [Liparis tanakae]|uniref:Uncharacterized protein n=1 Tax=Liparis tanakae TaxID=230148 RepID=A0A4Z2F0Q8_9TELE|nr:hypothetical protein EYF80_055301 [Liparis tanakae]
MLLALDTPKLWERFSVGLDSTGLGGGRRVAERLAPGRGASPGSTLRSSDAPRGGGDGIL